MPIKETNAQNIADVFNQITATNKYVIEDYEKAPAALPDSSLNFLVNVCKHFSVKSVFEFGSGRSTKALLSNGFQVASLEDSQYWLDETVKELTEEEKQNHTTFVKPLSTKWLGLFPVLDWKLDRALIDKLKNADVILIDSPYYTPFRESSLWTALQNTQNSIIILDDTRIPTLQRFCDRIAAANSSLFHFNAKVGHGFNVFIRMDKNKPLRLNHSLTDTVKGCLRYFKGLNFYRRLKKENG